MPVHGIKEWFSPPFVANRLARQTLPAYSFSLAVPRCRNLQFSRSFIPACVELWNSLNESALMVMVWMISRSLYVALSSDSFLNCPPFFIFLPLLGMIDGMGFHHPGFKKIHS